MTKSAKNGLFEAIQYLKDNYITINNDIPSENMAMKTIYRKSDFLQSADSQDDQRYKSLGLSDIIEDLEKRFDL